MEYVNIARFFRAKFEVRKQIINWWEPEIGDLVEGKNGEVKCLDSISKVEDIKALLKNQSEYIVTPLLTVHQLINFIEWKTDKCLLIRNAEGNKHFIHLFNRVEQEDGTFLSETIYKEYANNLLEGLWRCVQEICK